MNKNLILTPIIKDSGDGWLKFRMNGIGGSESAIVLNLNPYQSAIELFYKKVFQEIEHLQNERMFWGNVHEDTIANIWQYWNPETSDINEMMSNYENNKIIRKCKKVNSIIQNPKYPQLLANIDRLIIGKEGILEIKTISDFAVNQWESGIPPYHIVQLQTYLAILEMEYGELAMLKNGRNFGVIPFTRNEEIISGIDIKTEEFWERVLEAREIIKNGGSIEHLEPEPDNSVAYETFMKKRFKTKPVTIGGTPEMLDVAKAYMFDANDIKSATKDQQLQKNKLIDILREAEKIDFGKNGYVSFRENNNGVRTLLVKIKD
jgi:putative phage-type endonuclease